MEKEKIEMQEITIGNDRHIYLFLANKFSFFVQVPGMNKKQYIKELMKAKIELVNSKPIK